MPYQERNCESRTERNNKLRHYAATGLKELKRGTWGKMNSFAQQSTRRSIHQKLFIRKKKGGLPIYAFVHWLQK